MTDDERAQYAAEQRRACAPAECDRAPNCWMLHGGKDRLILQSMTKTPRCAACTGKLRWLGWREPRDLALSPQAERLARRQNSKQRQFALDV